MKHLLSIFVLMLAVACNNTPNTGTFGEKFEKNNVQDFKTALSAYNSGKDETFVIEGKIDNVCQHSGCWLTFKNDSADFYVNTNEKFTLPKDSKGKKAIAKGKFVKDENGEVSFSPSGVIIE